MLGLPFFKEQEKSYLNFKQFDFCVPKNLLKISIWIDIPFEVT